LSSYLVPSLLHRNRADDIDAVAIAESGLDSNLPIVSPPWIVTDHPDHKLVAALSQKLSVIL